MKYKKNVSESPENLTIEELINQRVTKNINEVRNEKLSFGDRFADRIASFAGSWKFIGIFFFILIFWMLFNTLILIFVPFDPFPFTLLNLMLGVVSSMQAPIIMMSQNRQEERNQLMAEQNYKVDLKQEVLLEEIYQKVNKLEDDIKKLEDKINK
jgi:uncharacterized membrane protein